MGIVIGKCSKSDTYFFSSETNFFLRKTLLNIKLKQNDYHIRLQERKS